MPSRLDSVVQRIINKDDADSSLAASYDAGEWSFSFPCLILYLSGEGGCLTSRIINNKRNIHRKVLDPLRQQVRNGCNAANGGKLPTNDEALLIVILEAIEIVLDFEIEEETSAIEASGSKQKWKVDRPFDYNLLLDNAYGLDVSSVADTANYLLGKTPEQLIEGIPNQFRVIHIESILRNDLVQRFHSYRERLEVLLEHDITKNLRHAMSPHSKLAAGKILSALPRESVIEDMLIPRVTYHGTPLRNVSSIVRHGFKMPGTKIENGRLIASPRSGIAFNRGIYSSQAPFYALSYASHEKQPTPIGDLPTMRLFVCATLMGRTLSDNTSGTKYASVHGHLVEGYDAHFDGDFEYIVHHPAAILPCYVIHLDMGSEQAKRAIAEAQANPFAFHRAQKEQRLHPKLDKKVLAPGDTKREAEAKKAAAMKWFPAGFGSAKGTNFVIEEIGEVDDDEEEYGEWQAEKHGFFRNDEGNAGWLDARFGDASYEDFDEDGNRIVVQRQQNALDQYQAARSAKGPKR